MKKDRGRTQLLVGLGIVALLAIGVTAVGLRFGQEREKAAKPASAGPDVQDGIVLELTVLAVDPIKSEMTARVIPTPHGSYGDLAYAKRFTIVTGTSNGLRETDVKVGTPVTSFDVTTSMHDGQVTNYPFDEYKAELGFLVYAETRADEPAGSGARSSDPATEPEAPGPGVETKPVLVPLQVTVEGVLHGYKLTANPTVDKNPIGGGEVSVSNTEFTIGRSGSTRFFAVFVMVLMWAISLGILWIALSVLFRRRKIELAILSVFGIVLFALPNIRNAQPSAPPIGSLTDVLAFFWCESLVAVCLVAMIIVFVRRTEPGDGEPSPPEAASTPTVEEPVAASVGPEPDE